MNVCLELRKKQIRTKFLSLRNNLTLEVLKDYSMETACKAKALSIYKKAKTIMFYLSCGREMSTDLLINFAFEDKKDVSVAAITNMKSVQMRAVRIFKLKEANRLFCGIRQPEVNKNNVISKESIDLFFVPGIVFSELGYRIGYGKGFYDRFLKGIDCAKIVGLAYDFQVVKDVPVAKHDIPVGSIVTEKRFIKVLDV
ncbi:MAG: 5-formyltetrahydrofolate cyclo-ligase [Endomicrobium sp.]|nr:5-formyltetrahydrofolate cyclo-ligase [Endomicrobium sp.]